MGGVDYGPGAAQAASTKSREQPLATVAHANLRAARELKGMAPLEHSLSEARTIAELYTRHNKNGETLLLSGKNASEQALRNLKEPPRINATKTTVVF